VFRKRALCFGRCPDRVARAPESEEERFSLTIDKGSAVLGERAFEQAHVGVGYFAIAAPKATLELG
jgi:hypothetical protein